jgi:hypothetical protein
MTDNTIIVLILLVLNFFVFVLGLLCGRIFLSVQSHNQTQSFFQQKNKTAQNNISIDDTRYVVDIKTDNLEKKYDKLGDTTQSTEQISSSINKLKNLKK